MLAIVVERDRHHVVCGELRAQLEILAHAGLQVIEQVRACGYRVAIGKFSRHSSTAHLVVCLEQQHLLAGPGQQRRTYEAVMATPDNNCIVFISHRRSSPEPCWVVSGPRGSREPRLRQVRP